jgi:hypothetical protein
MNDAGVKIMFFLAGVLMGWNAWVYRQAWTFFAKRAYQRNELFQRERIVSFTEENVTSDAMAQHLELKWSAFTHHKESQSLFLLFQSPNFANCVPKRVFTQEQSVQFRALLQRKIPAR